MFGRPCATTTARSAVRGTCRPTRAKMRRETMGSVPTPGRAERIRLLNDGLRTTFSGGRVVLIEGVDALCADLKARVFSAVRTFTAFDSDCDPHGEHDFGSF